MSDNPPIVVEIGGEKLDVILPGYGDGWTFDEAMLAKTVSDGLSPVEIEQRTMVGDPQAWMAVLQVSYLRAGRDYPAAVIRDTNIFPLIDAVADAMQEVVDEGTPTSPPKSGGGSETKTEPTGDRSSEKTT